ncbi:redoxin domain-containing protein [Altererythrobacter xixiisoli]|uniref:thioredoxin-dependent peroxiredoxin n=1 Tax=Croceibacterium xixiisoli TaxID=1476466 RepID=A0A6I4TQK0_9SPHN|nr:peroxiredoxin [Croceibacterium xixiisoli]MXO97619.1 redoxin domain-containing protein [Croceibacterium xixiisoli]
MSTRPDIGDLFPAIALQTPEGGSISAADLRGKPAVLFFYPKDDTPGCTTEASDFSTLLPQFTAAGVAVLGISKDPPAKHVKFTAKHGLTVPLASDAETDGLADALDIWVEKNMYGRTYMGMERTTYLIDAEGRIASVWRKVKVKDHAAAVLAAAQALRS